MEKTHLVYTPSDPNFVKRGWGSHAASFSFLAGALRCAGICGRTGGNRGKVKAENFTKYGGDAPAFAYICGVRWLRPVVVRRAGLFGQSLLFSGLLVLRTGRAVSSPSGAFSGQRLRSTPWSARLASGPGFEELLNKFPLLGNVGAKPACWEFRGLHCSPNCWSSGLCCGCSPGRLSSGSLRLDGFGRNNCV